MSDYFFSVEILLDQHTQTGVYDPLSVYNFLWLLSNEENQ
mgnify:CR=1 FL=1